MTDLRVRWRRLALGLPTLLGGSPRGWFIPYRYAAQLPAAGASPAYPAIEALFAAQAPTFRAVLQAVEAQGPRLRAIAEGRGGEGGGVERAKPPRFDQGWFPTLDAAVAYSMVAQAQPRRIIEVGSGHSTRFLARAASDGGLPTRILAVDPAPRADIARLANVELIRAPVHAAPLERLCELAAGDMLFVDSSHILMPGSDVDLLFNRVLPALPAGVLVHVHDIALPDDYPPAWGWRGYNEQQGVAALLQGGAWRPLFSSRYAQTRMGRDIASLAPTIAALPRHPQAFDASLWLEKTV